MPPDPSLPPAGWYPDPYRAGSQRWFDGSEWTGHAVPSDTPNPDARVDRDLDATTPGELQSQEHFSSNDPSIPQAGEPRYDGGGGWQGLYANRVGRGVMRASTRWGPIRPSRWLAGLTVVLALCAWGDPVHRFFLAPAAAMSLVATIVFAVREAKERAYWRKVGRSD